MAYSEKKFGFAPERTIVAGDSGNDIDMFQNTEMGVIVKNHSPEIKEWMNENAERLKNKYISGFKYADAVLEALIKLENSY